MMNPSLSRSKTLTVAHFGAALAITPLASHAAVVFTEDFETPAAGSFITAGNTNFTNVGTSSSNLSFTATTDTGDIFGNGTSNKFNRTIDNTASSIIIRADDLDLGNLITYSASYRNTGTASGFTFRIALPNSATTGANRNADVTVGNLTGFAGFSNSTTYRFDLVANYNGPALTDYYGDEDLAANTYDLFVTSLDGSFQTQVLDDQPLINLPGTTDANGFSSVSFQTFTSATGIDFAWDDVEVRDDAFVSPFTLTTPIPEPSAAGLIGSFGLLALVRRRR